MTRSTPARVLALIGMLLQVPLLAWYLLLGKRWGFGWLLPHDLAGFLDLMNFLLVVACIALAGVSLGARTRRRQAVLVIGALGAWLLTLIILIAEVVLLDPDDDKQSMITWIVRQRLGFGDYSFSYLPGFFQAASLASTGGMACLLAASIVVWFRTNPVRADAVTPSCAQASPTALSSPVPAPGWYPQASGGHKYWDGSTWLTPSPESSAVGGLTPLSVGQSTREG